MGARNQSRRGQLPVAGPSQLSNVGYGSLSSRLATSLGETFGNIVGRLAATPAVLTPVIPAFGASVLVVHPVLPDRDHAAMLAMVKDGSWFRLAHRHHSSRDATVRGPAQTP